MTTTATANGIASAFALLTIARTCHEANRAYCSSIGDNSQPSWEDAPDWQRDSAINGVKAHWEALSAGGELSPSQSHESWLEQKRAEGWKYGPTKNPETKEHPCFLPYDGLPVEQRVKDYVFAGIVKSFWAATKLALATTDRG